MYSQSEENYLKAIYLLGNQTDKTINTNQLAKRMRTKASSVTDMVKKLNEKELVDYEKYKGANLTHAGKKIALSVLRKHRLWETFLVEKLNFPWDEVHDIAEQLEHIQSPELVNRLDAFLGFPATDPHGDPIPNKAGKIISKERRTLASMPVGSQVVLVGLKESTDDFLRYLDSRKLSLGDELMLVSMEAYDQSVNIKKGDITIVISRTAADNLLVKNRT